MVAPPAPAPGGGSAAPTSTPKSSALSNRRKGYKLTLVISATTEAGLADAHGILQLDGADPIPFCRLKDVQNPLAGALQEAYLAVERVRAKPPKMAAPPMAAAPAAPVAVRTRPAPHAHGSASQPAAAPARPAAPPAPLKQAAPVDQATLF